MSNWDNFWKEGWERTRARFVEWWQREGMILYLTAPLDEPRIAECPPDVPVDLNSGFDPHFKISEPASIETVWLDPPRRVHIAELSMAATFYGAEAFPYFDTQIGPGNLATFIGSPPQFDENTVWYKPCITDPENHPPLRFDPENPWFLKQQALIEAGLRASDGRFLVGMPDLVENLDILASLRDTQTLMYDMIERPDFVKQRIDEINEVYFEAFDHFFDLIQDPWGGNAFSAFKIWGPGKTAKVQCDAAALISPRMFREFVSPAMTAQCDWLDYSMYHLDGTQAMPQLENLLAIESLDAIEWTPQAGKPSGGDSTWYDLYRKILEGGKSVQAIGVKPDEVIPLIEAVGTEGLFITARADTEAEARELIEKVEQYR